MMKTASGFTGAAIALLAAGSIAAGTARAQDLPTKRTISAQAAASPCAPMPAPPRPSAANQEEARRLTARGHEAAIVGDFATARSSFRRAAQLDPTNEDIAYQYARTLEDAKATDEATREYCRYLALAPNAAQAAEVRARVAQLAPSPNVAPTVAMASFRSALAHMDAHQWRPARAALDSAIARSPQWPEAYYDRALTSIALQQPAAAIGDLESYLRLRPEADDRTAVVATIGALRRQQLSPSGALVRGIVIPGLGQFYTRRPIPGVLVLGAVAGAIVFAEQSQRTTEDRSYTDPFGNVVHYSVQVDKRPHEVAGLAAAGAVALGAAIESFFYARGVRASDRPPAPAPPRRAALRIAPVIAPSANGALRLGVSLGSSAP